jgi:DNA phosphorothioation-dependent restriction protein DptG
VTTTIIITTTDTFKDMTSKSTTGFDQLAGEFTESLDQFDQDAVTEALEDAGIQFRKDGGRVILHLQDGIQVFYGVAVKQGLIKVSRA